MVLKPRKSWEKLLINWCRISSINSLAHNSGKQTHIALKPNHLWFISTVGPNSQSGVPDLLLMTFSKGWRLKNLIQCWYVERMFEFSPLVFTQINRAYGIFWISALSQNPATGCVWEPKKRPFCDLELNISIILGWCFAVGLLHAE